MSFADGSGSLRSVFRKHRRVPGSTEGLFGTRVLYCGLRTVTVLSTCPRITSRFAESVGVKADPS